MDNNGNNRNGDYQTIGSKRLKVVSHRLQSRQFCNCIGRNKTQYITDIENGNIVCFQCSPTQQGKACNHYPIKQHCSRSCITIHGEKCKWNTVCNQQQGSNNPCLFHTITLLCQIQIFCCFQSLCKTGSFTLSQFQYVYPISTAEHHYHQPNTHLVKQFYHLQF